MTQLRFIVSTLLELLGLAAVVVGVALFDPRVAVILAGLVVVLVGVAVDPPARRGPKQ